MPRASLTAAFGTLLLFASCSDDATGVIDAETVAIGAETVAVTAGAAAGETPGTVAHRRVVTPSAPTAAVVGVYEIDTDATGRCAGLLGGLVESRVRGSTLELRADGTYVGRKDGRRESTGTWSRSGARLTLHQTQEGGAPVRREGTATIRDGVLSVVTCREGLEITLVFARS